MAKFLVSFLLCAVSLLGQTRIDYKQIKNGPSISPAAYGALGNGTTDDTAALQAAINAAASTAGCVYLTAQQYKVTGSLTSPALGQLCIKGNYNAAPYAGVVSGIPPRSSSLIQYQNNAKTLSLTGLSNVVDGIDFTIASGVTGVTAIYGTDTVSQPMVHNTITNNNIHGYSTGSTQGTFLAKGIDLESIGANVNNNTLTGNVVQLATYGYYFNGASSSQVVNSNIFHNWAMNCTHAAYLNNTGEMATFWLSMEGNGDAVTAIGSVASGFFLDNGEQAPPHLILSGGSHDNTLWSSQRCRNSGLQCMTVTADSQVNNIIDLSGLWQGVDSSAARFWCFGCVTESSNATPSLATVQWMPDTSGTRPAYRLADPVNFNTISLVSFSPNGVDNLGHINYYFANRAVASTSALMTHDQRATGGVLSYDLWQINGTDMGGVGARYYNSSISAIRTATLFTYDSGGTQVFPFWARGDGPTGPGIEVAVASLPACNATLPPGGTLQQTVAVNNLLGPTLGSAPAGGGAVHGLVHCNGGGWTVSAI